MGNNSKYKYNAKDFITFYRLIEECGYLRSSYNLNINFL